jgi:ApeA-like protein
MMEEFEYQRYWWLPDEPEERVPGTLKFDPEGGASLNLLGSFRVWRVSLCPLSRT